jgi:UDP-N-acetylglucosamine--N-acetylmuramyl-(pentapeptide) pyrophosphoryl-undecaprenol N-acetylglucosamine transferase
MHVVLAGGGTAGHVEPALAVADALRRRHHDVGITALGTQRGLETRLVPARGYELALIPAVPLPRTLTPQLLGVPGRVRDAVQQTRAVLRRTAADVVVGFGGYVATPAYLAARAERVPIVVHEANARPGLANRLGARLTPHVGVATPDIRLPHARHVGIPLRHAIATLDREATREQARAHFGLDLERPTLLVFGGSQGARRLNEALAVAAAALLAAGIQVLHAAGPDQQLPGQLPGLAAPPTDGPPYRLLPYIDRMDLAYAAADLAISRAGAMTCAELAAVGLPSIYVPFPIGNGEQRFNALPVVRAGGGLLVDDAELTGAWVREHVPALLTDPARRRAMASAAAAFGRRDADEQVVDMVEHAVRTAPARPGMDRQDGDPAA